MSSGNPRYEDWFQGTVWPQISSMMLDDALFHLFARVHELTDIYNGPFASLVIRGYISNQTIAIRRLCDPRRDVISLRKLVEALRDDNLIERNHGQRLLERLDRCDRICDLVSDHIAHTANPERRKQVSAWTLNDNHIVEAQEAICKVGISIWHKVFRTAVGAIIPTFQYDFMREYKTLVLPDQVSKLHDFWRDHCKKVDQWCDELL